MSIQSFDINFDDFDDDFNEDRVGGFSALEADIYGGVIKTLYKQQNDTENSKTKSFVIEIDILSEDNKARNYREVIFYSNREGIETYVDKNTKKLRPMVGLVRMNELANLLTGENLDKANVEMRVVKKYDSQLKKEVETEVPMFIDFIDQKIKFGVIKKSKEKMAKDNFGIYNVPTGEMVEENSIDKFFDYDTNKTAKELKEDKEAENYDKWLKANKGKVKQEKNSGSKSEKGSKKTTSSTLQF